MTSMVKMFVQVGQGDDYVLTVEGFNASLSTLGDEFSKQNGRKFTAR